MLKGAFRRSMNWLHTWTGLALGWLLFFVFVTGTVGYFDTEIDRWMQPELPLKAQNVSQEKLINMGLFHLQEKAIWSSKWQITLPEGRYETLGIAWKKPDTGEVMRNGGSMNRELIDYETGLIAEPRDTAGGQALYKMHYRLHYMPAIVAFWLVGLATMFMLLAIVTGIIIHIRIFKDFFTFRPKEGAKSWLDAHSVVSVIALPFHLMITYSGLAFFVFTFMGMVIIANYDVSDIKNIRSEAFPRHTPAEPANIDASMVSLTPLLVDAKKQLGEGVHLITVFNPNDENTVISFRRSNTTLFGKQDIDEVQFSGVTGLQLPIIGLDKPEAPQVRSVLLGLHEGHYANIIMRWFYFIAGVLGSMMIATGMLLWVEKRRFKYENKQAPTRGYLFVHRTNAGIIVGLPMAIAVYFIANRLLPIDLLDRSAWEINALFFSLLAFMIFPFLRPLKKFWVEMLIAAAVLFFAVPIVNAITTDKHIIATAIAQDWTLLTFDLLMLIFGAKFLFAAYRVNQRQASPTKKIPTNKRRRVSPVKKVGANQVVATRSSLPYTKEV